MPTITRPGSPLGRPWPRLEHRVGDLPPEAQRLALLRDIDTLENLIEEMMGEDNTEIDALRDDLEEANDRADTAEDEAREVDDLRDEVEELKDQLEEAKEEIAELKERK